MKDKLGILISGLCVFHCILFAFVFWGGLSSLSFLYISEKLIHPILLAIVFIIGLISFPSGYRNHNKIQPLILGSLGTIGLFAAIFFSTILEVITTILFLNSTLYSPVKNTDIFLKDTQHK